MIMRKAQKLELSISTSHQWKSMKSKAELIGRFCKNDWCNQFFLAKGEERLCKSCRRKHELHESKGYSHSNSLHSGAGNSAIPLGSSKGAAIVTLLYRLVAIAVLFVVLWISQEVL